MSGQRIPASSAPFPVVSLKIKNSGEVVRCTGSFVSSNTLITAAHCFDPVALACRNNHGCHRDLAKNLISFQSSYPSFLSINEKSLSSDFKILLHPSYKSLNDTGIDGYDKTNEDVALVIFPKENFSQSYIRVSEQKPSKGTRIWTYGAGMTAVKLFNNPETGEAYNIEEHAGILNKKTSEISEEPTNGLLQLQAQLVGKKVNSHLYELEISRGLQVLSADSGEPRISKRKISGMGRNFTFSFFPTKKSSENMEVSGKSVFTSLTTDSQKAFLNSARAFGGEVNF